MTNYREKIYKIFSTGAFIPPPSQSSSGGGVTFRSVVNTVTDNIFTPLITVLGGLALVAFLYGVLKYIQPGASEGDKKKARSYIIWSLIGLTVMVSVWGLVKILQQTFPNIDYSNTLPTIVEPR